MLMQAHTEKVAKCVLKQVRVWPEGATSALQDCFETGKCLSKQPPTTPPQTLRSIQTLTTYITKCIDVTHTKTITILANQKLWQSTSCWGPEKIPSELGIKLAWEQRDPTCPEASGKQNKTTHDNLPFQRQQGCTEPVVSFKLEVVIHVWVSCRPQSWGFCPPRS